MQVKLFEVRDRATFIPAFAMRMLPVYEMKIDGKCQPHELQRYLLRRAGYSCDPYDPIIIFGYLEGNVCKYDPYGWVGPRTMKVAHDYVQTHFDELNDGDVIDVEFILGETTEKKVSERETV